MAIPSIGCSECEALAIESILQFRAVYRANRCHAIQAETRTNHPINNGKGFFHNSTHDLQVLQVADSWRNKFKIIVAQI